MSALARPSADGQEMEQSETDLLREIRERYDAGIEADETNRNEAESDLKFVSGEQWPENIKLEREGDNRPVITENQLPQFVRQIAGDMRSQRPSIKVVPDGGGASQEVAEIYTGIIRDIEAKAATKRPYITAGASAARCGIGHWRILHDYESDTSFDQCIYIESIPNPFAVIWDPLATEITRQDAGWCFVTDPISEEDFEAQYPDAKSTSFDVSESWSNDWYDKTSKSVRIAEYWRKRPVKRVLIQTADGQTGFLDEVPPGYPLQIVRQREVDSYVVEVIKTNGFEILEPARKWPTKHIPIIAVVGEEYAVGEGRVRHSAIRFAKDSQRLYNYWLSTQTEHLALQPKAPFVATAKQIGPYKDMWTQANEKNYPVLIYDADPQAPGQPQRSQPPVASVAMTEQVMRAASAMKATTGIYDAGLGNKSNESSGRAIMARQRESDVSTSEFLDNLAASVAYTGEQIVELIPYIYDTQRQIRILSEDGSETFEQINQRMQTPQGEVLVNALKNGRYAVSVSTGPSYTTKRQEAAESMLAFIQANPASASIVLDLVAKNMDWPGAEEFAERFRKGLPPQFQPETDDPEEQQARQAAAQQAQQAQQTQERVIGADIAEKEGKAAKSQADAKKSEIEAQAMQMELMLKSGALQQVVADQVRQVLVAMFPPQLPQAAIAPAMNGAPNVYGNSRPQF